MNFIAEINVMPLKALLDPQGKAVTAGLQNLGLKEIDGVRIGKHIYLEVEAANKDAANEKVKAACEKLLCNKVMEYYEFSLSES